MGPSGSGEGRMRPSGAGEGRGGHLELGGVDIGIWLG